MKKEYYTSAELESAQSGDIIHALKSMGYPLKKEGHFYRGVEHDSMVINENTLSWSWNSRDLHGRKPVELLKQILIHDYGYDDKSACITAIKRLAGTEGQNLKSDNQDYYYSQRKPYNNSYDSPKINENDKKGELVLPERNKTCSRVVAYLCKTRCLDYEIVKDLIINKQLYETKDKHNACFVSYDKEGVPKHAFMRGTLTTPQKGFKQDVANSDKSYGFALKGHSNANTVCCFESAIDAISYASMYKLLNLDYKENHLLALNGLSFSAIERFLEENPNVKTVVTALDNDEAGIKQSKKICEHFENKGYKTYIEEIGDKANCKDFNEDLKQLKKTIDENAINKSENMLEDDLER